MASANVVNFAEKKIQRDDHLGGEAICVGCGHIWQAVTPIGAFEGLECPECGGSKGVLRYCVVPESTWMCACGCWLFTVSGISGDILCWQCGVPQRWDNDEVK